MVCEESNPKRMTPSTSIDEPPHDKPKRKLRKNDYVSSGHQKDKPKKTREEKEVKSPAA
jgi:hypothetical protein